MRQFRWLLSIAPNSDETVYLVADNSGRNGSAWCKQTWRARWRPSSRICWPENIASRSGSRLQHSRMLVARCFRGHRPRDPASLQSAPERRAVVPAGVGGSLLTTRPAAIQPAPRVALAFQRKKPEALGVKAPSRLHQAGLGSLDRPRALRRTPIQSDSIVGGIGEQFGRRRLAEFDPQGPAQP